MKVWVADLVLDINKNDEFLVKFDFGQALGNGFTKEGRYWVTDINSIFKEHIPMDLKIGVQGDIVGLRKGFDRELTKKEQELLEIKMKVYLKEYLRKENEKINKQYENKMAAIKF